MPDGRFHSTPKGGREGTYLIRSKASHDQLISPPSLNKDKTLQNRPPEPRGIVKQHPFESEETAGKEEPPGGIGPDSGRPAVCKHLKSKSPAPLRQRAEVRKFNVASVRRGPRPREVRRFRIARGEGQVRHGAFAQSSSSSRVSVHSFHY